MVVQRLGRGGVRSREELNATVVPTTAQTAAALKAVGVHAPSGIQVGTILALLESPEHSL